MKKIVLIVFFGSLITTKISAQVMAAKAQTVVIKSANLRCWTCKEKLEEYLVRENEDNMQSGMLKRTYNLMAGEIRVQFLPDRVSSDNIKIAINNAGFDTDSTKATPDSYKLLPPICKRKEDGGGPQKGKPCHVEPY
jgi:outer membrane protein OmpA-like peptidoglycan-associated protein